MADWLCIICNILIYLAQKALCATQHLVFQQCLLIFLWTHVALAYCVPAGALKQLAGSIDVYTST
eukprot:1159073-Pelagomonas_calceolata.AAC.4